MGIFYATADDLIYVEKLCISFLSSDKKYIFLKNSCEREFKNLSLTKRVEILLNRIQLNDDTFSEFFNYSEKVKNERNSKDTN